MGTKHNSFTKRFGISPFFIIFAPYEKHSMDRLPIILSLAALHMAAYSQDDLYMNSQPLESTVEAIDMEDKTLTADTTTATYLWQEGRHEGAPEPWHDEQPLSLYAMPGGAGISYQPLHDGLNISVGAAVTAEIGENSHGGVGFSQSVDAAYATQLTNRLFLTVGAYLNNMYWSGDHYMNAGLTASLHYSFDEHWMAFLYAQKTLYSSDFIPLTLMDQNDNGDRIGAGITYKFNQKLSVSMSVDCLRHDFKGNKFGASFSNGSFSLGGGLLPHLNFRK